MPVFFVGLAERIYLPNANYYARMIRIPLPALVFCIFGAASGVHAQAQQPLTLDLSYGKNGLAVEPLPRNWTTMPTTHWFVNADGTAYTVRAGEPTDTTALISRLMTNGHIDPFFGRDGFTPLGSPLVGTMRTFYPLEVYHNPNGLIISDRRLNRREVYLIPPTGGLPSLPVWQDSNATVASRIIAVNPNDGACIALVASNGQEGWDRLRHYTNVGTRQMRYEDFEIRIDSVDLVFQNSLRFCVDRNGRILAFRNRGDRLVGTRYNANGTIDETFGNAMGRVVMPSTLVVQSVRQLRDGSYMVVIGGGSELQLVRFNESGGLEPLWGERGVASVLERTHVVGFRDLLELPNGDFILLATGTASTSHLYWLRRDGSIVPQRLGEFDLTNIVALSPMVVGNRVFGLIGSLGNLTSIARFVLDERVSSVGTLDLEGNAQIMVDASSVHISQVSGPLSVDIYDLHGRRVASQACEHGGTCTFTRPEGVTSGLYMIVLTAPSNTRTIPLFF